MVLNEIKYELQDMNGKLDDIKGHGLYNSITDINQKLDEIKGSGLFDSISDVHDKLEEVSNTVSSIDLNTI